MTSILKVDTIQDTAGNNIINESGDTITIGASGDTVNVVGTLQNNGSAVGGGTQEFDAGTVSLPSITTTGDTNTGIFFPSADTIAFTEGGTESMRINSSGDVLMGTDSTTILADRESFSFMKSGGTVHINGKNGNTVMDLNQTFDDSVTRGAMRFYRNETQVGSITVSTTATAFVTSSDYRLKENINYDFDATTRLKQLKPARFNFISEPNKTVDGFLAHEVQDVIPEAITGTKDEIDFEENPVYQGIDQAKLTPILTKALQEAIAKIEQLEARLTALESN